MLLKVKLADAEKSLRAKSTELGQERDKNLGLMKEMTDLRKQITELLGENKLLKENETSLTEEFDVCEQELAEARAEAGKVIVLEAEIEKLRAELKKDTPTDAVELRIQMEAREHELSDMYVSYERQTAELQKALKDLDKAHAENAKLSQQFETKLQDYIKASDDGGKSQLASLSVPVYIFLHAQFYYFFYASLSRFLYILIS